jgi:hypothetical protein
VDAETTELHEFRPDWTLAPAVTLRVWMRQAGIHAEALACRAHAATGGGHLAEMTAAIRQVLDREPLTGTHAAVLAAGTGIPARYWLALEEDYRAGLAAGRTDITPGATATDPAPVAGEGED